MAFQFSRIELFSRKGQGGRSTGFVFDEVARVPAASTHVREPGAPVIVMGLAPDALRVLHDERAASAKQEVKGGKMRAIRADQNTLVTVILSHPVTMDEYRESADVHRDVEDWQSRSVRWLRDQFGDRLVSVVRHEDESHPHLHCYILPADLSMKATALHPGFAAKAAVVAAGTLPGEDDKALGKRANAAYQQAMRSWLDDYHTQVGQPCGLTRIGPKRRHLTRAEWQAEKQQATSLKDALVKAEILKKQGQAFISRAKDQAAKIQADTARQADAAKAAIAAAQAAERQAIEREKSALRATQRAVQATSVARRLSGFGGALRGLWDGLRKSSLAARLQEQLRPTIERWQSAEALARAQLAAEAEKRLQAERRASAAAVAAAELTAQRDELRARLARFDPVRKTPESTLPRLK